MELAAEIEQIVLDVEQVGAHLLGQPLGEQQADVGVEFVDLADRAMRSCPCGTRVPSPSPVVPSSPVRVAICGKSVAHDAVLMTRS